MRDGERQGFPYFHVTTQEFHEMFERGDIFEYTMRHGTYRAMSKPLIQRVLDKNKIPLMNCDIAGIDALHKAFGKKNVLTIFIKADKAEIERRLIARGDSPADREVRLKDYENMMKNEPRFDKSVENIELAEAIEQVHRIINSRCIANKKEGE
jgi:guanylate kinase